MYWGVRGRDDLYLPDVPKAWMEQQPRIRYTPVLSDSGEARLWRGAKGLVHRQVARDYPDLSGHDVYLCGPPVMIHAAKKVFTRTCGLPENRLFFDAFEDAA